MFDKLLRELRHLEEGVSVPIQIPLDEAGYMDRCCPGDACGAQFKVLYDDWRNKVLDERVFCPICRHQEEATSWNTADQEEYISQVALQYVQEVVDRGLRESARDFNRRNAHGNGFLKVSMSVKPGSPMVTLPVETADALRQQFTCEVCDCRYSSVGAAFFCPACGHNSAGSTFDQTLTTVEKTLDGLAHVRTSLVAAFNEDIAEDSVRHLLENSLGRLVGAFQRLSEALFDDLANRSQFTPRRNVFQNLSQASDLWEQAGKSRYEQLLSQGEFTDLQRLFQQRHLLTHRDGVVDQDYIDRSGDTTYQPSQRLVIREAAVRRLLELVQKLATALRGQVP